MISSIEVRGVTELIEMLGALPGEVKKAARTSLNRQITQTRKEDLVTPGMAATGLKRAALNAALPLKKAGSNSLKSEIKASGSGIPVPAFRYRWQRVTQQIQQSRGASPTRARILVAWPGGEKVAAGFVNPKGQYQATLTTRRKGYKLAVALAPSAATLRKELYGSSNEQQTADQLAEKFNNFLTDIVSRRPVPDE